MYTYIEVKEYDFDDTSNFELKIERNDLENPKYKPVVMSDLAMGETFTRDMVKHFINPETFNNVQDDYQGNSEWNISNVEYLDNLSITYNTKDITLEKFQSLIKKLFKNGNKCSKLCQNYNSWRGYPINKSYQLLKKQDEEYCYLLVKDTNYATCAGRCLSLEVHKCRSFDIFVKHFDIYVLEKLCEPYRKVEMDRINDNELADCGSDSDPFDYDDTDLSE